METYRSSNQQKVVGINALFMIPNQVGGTEYYLRSYIESFSKIEDKISFVIFSNLEAANTWGHLPSNWKIVVCPLPAKSRILRLLYEQLILPWQVKKNHCQILHSFGYFGPFWGAPKLITTIYDANYLDCPEDFSTLTIFLLSFLVKYSIKKSSTIITSSTFSKARLSYFFPGFSHKIRVIWPGINPVFAPKNDTDSHFEYFLCVSAFYPHKKIPYLLTLFNKYHQKNPKSKLVLIGQNGKEEQLIASMISKSSGVSWRKKVTLPELVKLYQEAIGVIQPSVYEGFGYPVYEAIACAKPVIVGAKKLYKKSIHPCLTELNFNTEQDIEKLKELSTHTDKCKLDLTYLESAQELLELYHEIMLR